MLLRWTKAAEVHQLNPKEPITFACCGLWNLQNFSKQSLQSQNSSRRPSSSGGHNLMLLLCNLNYVYAYVPAKIINYFFIITIIFSCRTESAAALAKTFWKGLGWGLLGDVSKFLSTCTLMNSVGDQHVVSMLPACCLHVANKLPACCQHVASMLSACCQHVASLLPANY